MPRIQTYFFTHGFTFLPEQKNRCNLSAAFQFSAGENSLRASAAIHHQSIRASQSQQLVLQLFPGHVSLFAKQQNLSGFCPAHCRSVRGRFHVRRQIPFQFLAVLQNRHAVQKRSASVRRHNRLSIFANTQSPVVVLALGNHFPVNHQPTIGLEIVLVAGSVVEEVAVHQVGCSGDLLNFIQAQAAGVVKHRRLSAP